MGDLLGPFLHIVLLLGLAPGFSGAAAAIRTRACGGRWLSPRLPYAWLASAARHGLTVPLNASSFFLALPCLSLAATALAAILTPGFLLDSPLSGGGDLVLITGLLSLSLAARILSAMDPGRSQTGIASLRQAGLGIWMEPVLLLTVSAFAMLGGSPSLTALHNAIAPPGSAILIAILLLPGFCLAALAGADELTAAGEAPPEFLSGPLLATAAYERQLRLFTWAAMLAAIFLPAGMISTQAGILRWIAALFVWLLKMLLLALALGLAQARLARPAAARGPAMLLLGGVFALLAVLCLLAGQYPA